MADLEPGWLMKTLHLAHMQCMLDHSSQSLKRMGLHLAPDAIPISDDEARELFTLMNERFRSWTGKNLKDMQLPSHNFDERANPDPISG